MKNRTETICLPPGRETCVLPIRTPDGEFIACYSAKGLCGLDFPRQVKRPNLCAAAAQVPPQVRRLVLLKGES